MKKESKTTINVAEILAPIVGSRDLIDNLKESVKKADTKSVDLDFTDVEFVSRSAVHTLLSMKEDFQRKAFNKKEISFVNANKDVKEMFRLVAANRALPKKDKPDFQAEEVDINSLSKKPLTHFV